MKNILRLQQGFLLVIAVILIAIIAIIGLMLDYMFIGSVTATTNILQADQAFYIATSGLEMAKRSMVAQNQSCNFINSTYGNPTPLFLNHVNSPKVKGEFAVSCTSLPSTTLASTISASSTIIYLTSAVGFDNSGAISVDNEIINYSGKSGNTLLNAQRGAAGTTAASHAQGTTININAYKLISTGGVPTIAAAEGKRVAKQVLFLGSGAGGGLGNLPNGIAPSVTIGAGGSTSFNMPNGTVTIRNPTCSTTGCALATIGGATFSGTFTTYLNNSSTPSSYCNGYCNQNGVINGQGNGNMGSDINANNTSISSNYSTFYGYFFNSSIASMIASGTATNAYTLYNNQNLSGGIYYINGDVTTPSGVSGFQAFTQGTNPTILIINGNLYLPSGTNRIGSAGSPVTLIVNGTISLLSDVIINGFVYAKGGILSNSTRINGAFASSSGVTFSGNTLITFNSTILHDLGLMGGSAKIISSPEVF